jgi:hypothetical protein
VSRWRQQDQFTAAADTAEEHTTDMTMHSNDPASVEIDSLQREGFAVSVDLTATPPATEVPEFEQSGKPVRLGSEVLLVYPAGDADVALVTGLERWGRGVYVAVPGSLPQLVDVGALAPFEEEDEDLR